MTAGTFKGRYVTGAGLHFKSWVHYNQCRKHRQTWCWRDGEFYIWIYRQQEERVTLGLAWASETSKSSSSDTVPPVRPHLLQKVHSPNPFKECHTLWACGGHLHSNYHMGSSVTQQDTGLASLRRELHNLGGQSSAHHHWCRPVLSATRRTLTRHLLYLLLKNAT